MPPSDSPIGLCTAQESFRHLRALLEYASDNQSNESSIYGAISFILTQFCTSARVTSPKFKDLYLGSFPQRDLKQSSGSSVREFRAPDFTMHVVQSSSGRRSNEGRIGEMGPLIWEVKAGQTTLPWFGEKRSRSQLIQIFFPYFGQVVEQVIYAKAKFDRKPVYAMLSIDIWFVLLGFPGDPPSVTRRVRRNSGYPPHPTDFRKFDKYMLIPPTPIVNEDCTAFSPEFLYALQVSVKDLADITVMPHPSFCAPEGTVGLVVTQLGKQSLPEKFAKEADRVENENKFILGEEDTDERSSGWSTSEETETDLEKQAHPAKVPSTIDHFSTSPVKTRSQTAALRLRATAKASAQAGPSNVAENVAGPSRVVDPIHTGKSRRKRHFRKAAEKTPGYRKQESDREDETD